MGKIELDIPPEYLAELQKAAGAAGISLQSQILVAIAGWYLRRTGEIK